MKNSVKKDYSCVSDSGLSHQTSNLQSKVITQLPLRCPKIKLGHEFLYLVLCQLNETEQV